MSMKVYDAYKVKDPKNAWTLLWKLKEVARQGIRELLKKHYWELMINIDPESEEYQQEIKRRTFCQPEDWRIRLDLARDKVRAGYKENVTSAHRDTYTLDVTIMVYPHKGQYYLRAFCDGASVLRGALACMAKHKGLEDFHFQDSADKPKNVSERAWQRRKLLWNEMCDPKTDSPRGVALEICSWDAFYHVDPWLEMIQEFSAKKPTLPSLEEVWAAKIQRHVSDAKVQGSPGLITKGNKVLVRKLNTRWISIIDGKKKYHPDLKRAADYAYFCHLPDDVRNQIHRMIKDHKSQVRREKARAKKAGRAKA